MDNAINAVNKLFAKNETTTSSDQPEIQKTSTKNTTKSAAPNDVETTSVDSKVAAPVEHTHIRKEHETREQTVVEKEKHQDHYHTTIQPLKDSEVLPEKHDHIQETKHRNINNDDGAAKAKAEADRAGFESTSEEKKFEGKTVEPTRKTEHVHHHLHETIQPVIEKEVIDPSVTHKRVDVKEKIQEPSKYHGSTTNSAMSVDEFQKKVGEQN